MQLRRCAVLFIEPRETLDFDLASLLSGGDGLSAQRQWIALAPHIAEEVEIDDAACALLGDISAHTWIDTKDLPDVARPVWRRLLKQGLLIGKGRAHVHWRARDEHMRELYWHPLGATLQAFTRWEGNDAVKAMKDTGTETVPEMRQTLGPPPPESHADGDDEAAIDLPWAQGNRFDELLLSRVTCRNFDTARPLPLAMFAQLMQRVFAAQDTIEGAPDTTFLKKTSPSGGGLHPVEAYCLLQHVEGVAPGLYHYDCVRHRLAPLPAPATRLEELASVGVAHQHWFANAHAMVMLVPRFDRTFWKYRQHMKGYRVIALESGHLSQTLYLSATEAGLGAFITAAVNEKPLEEAFGLQPMSQGVMAICGFGWRGEVMDTTELDPQNRIWQAADAEA